MLHLRLIVPRYLDPVFVKTEHASMFPSRKYDTGRLDDEA